MMKTYKTYQECKIANPECEIVTTAPGWDASAKCIGTFEPLNTECYGPRYVLSDNAWVKCNPADYCMTVEQFLKDGHEFVDGDIYFHIKEEELSVVGRDGFESGHANTPIIDDADSYILRAAALEKPKQISDTAREVFSTGSIPRLKRTKVEFVKVEFDNAAEAYSFIIENGEVYGYEVDGFRPRCYLDLSGSFVWKYKENCASYSGLKGVDISQLYRRIETPMTEKEALAEALKDIWIIDGGDGEMQIERIVNSGKFKLVN